MNQRTIKSFGFYFTKSEENLFLIKLDNNRRMEVPMWSFYIYMSAFDENLTYYGGKFPEWEELTEDLISLNYDFKTNLEIYLQQFTDEQIKDFSFIEDSKNFDN